MSDNLQRRGPEDPQKVNLNQSWEVAYWPAALGVSEQVLRVAVQNVGTSVDAVKTWLRSNGYV